jgi:hypothetical protein
LLDENSRINLVGRFGWSWLLLKWDRAHPSFHDYACGLMAYEHAPHYAYLRDDPELQQEFPPKPLAGIDKGLHWNSPEMIAQSYQASVRCVQFWRDRGASDQKWLRIAVDEHNSYFSTVSGLEFSDRDLMRPSGCIGSAPSIALVSLKRNTKRNRARRRLPR